MRDPRSSQLVEANTTEPPNYALTRQQYIYFFFHFFFSFSYFYIIKLCKFQR